MLIDARYVHEYVRIKFARSIVRAICACLLGVLVWISVLPAQSVTAQTAISVSQDEIISYYPDHLTFRLSASSHAEIQNITLLYQTNAVTCQTAIAYQEPDFEPALSVEAEWEWDFTRSGILPPGAQITWQWQITDAAGNTLLTDERIYHVIDDRQNWQSLTNDQINLQWYQGSAAFGQDLMDIADQALQRLIEQAGVVPHREIWISIYPSSEAVQEVDIHASEWAGGIAYTEYQSTIIGIAPGELEWASSVLPHELAHLVTDALVFNCRGVWLPTWLSEGLAMFAEGSLSHIYNGLVISALDAGTLPPLRTLERGFSSDATQASRSYGQSSMVVAYLVEQYGPQSMADLLAAIQSGLTADEALQEVYQLDTDGLDAAWRVSLGYQPQSTQVALSASNTPVPTLALWTAVIPPSLTPSATATPSPAPSNTAIPETPQPLASPSPEAALTAQVAPTNGNLLPVWMIIVCGMGVLLALAGIVIFFIVSWRRKR